MSYFQTHLRDSCLEHFMLFMPQDPVAGKSRLVLVMAWCCQGTKPLPESISPSSRKPHGIIRGQWVNRAMVFINKKVTALRNTSCQHLCILVPSNYQQARSWVLRDISHSTISKVSLHTLKFHFKSPATHIKTNIYSTSAKINPCIDVMMAEIWRFTTF